MPLPLILAGPILRRVEPTLVSVWIALREPRHVQIRLWDGLVHDASESGLFTNSQPVIRPIADTAKTIRIGDQLHITVVSFKLPPNRPLLPDRIYSYNV